MTIFPLHFCLLRLFLRRLPLVREPPDDREEHRHEEADGDNHGLGHEHARGLVARQRVVHVGHGGLLSVSLLQDLPKNKKEEIFAEVNNSLQLT